MIQATNVAYVELVIPVDKETFEVCLKWAGRLFFHVAAARCH